MATEQVKIDHIKLTKCNPELVDARLEEYELNSSGSLKQRVSRLVSYYLTHESELSIANCDNCGADGDGELDACPFCGDEGELIDPTDSADRDDDGVDELTVHAEDEETDLEQEPEDEHDPEPSEDEEPEFEEEPEHDEAAEDQSTPEQPEVNEDPQPVPEQEEEPTMATKKAAKGAKKGKAPKPVVEVVEAPAPRGRAGRKAAAPNPEIVETTGIVVADSTELDKQVEIIRAHQISGATAMHRMGVAIDKIVKDNLWKQRVNEETGAPAFRSFKQFCVAELGITAVHAYRAMKISADFQEADIKEFSGKQVRLILEVPKEARGPLIEAAKRGEGAGKLTQRANELRGARKLPEPKKALTVAMTLGHTKLKMFKRPTTGSTKVGETEGAVRAKKLADQPWAVMDLSNKVRMMIRISTHPTSGEIMADVEFRRGDA